MGLCHGLRVSQPVQEGGRGHTSFEASRLLSRKGERLLLKEGQQLATSKSGEQAGRSRADQRCSANAGSYGSQGNRIAVREKLALVPPRFLRSLSQLALVISHKQKRQRFLQPP